VREEYSTSELVLCGEGPLQGELETLAQELCIREAVTFLGQVPYDEMPAVYRAGDVLVLPSRAEGVPRTIMEALSTGVPVVSSDLSQVRSAFGRSVEYVETGDSTVFCDRMCAVLDRFSAVELDSVFQWERTVKETTAALQTLVTS